MDWQPIETAPKDGTLVWTASKNYHASAGGNWTTYNAAYRYEDDLSGDWLTQNGTVILPPAYWMPMPPEPKHN